MNFRRVIVLLLLVAVCVLPALAGETEGSGESIKGSDNPQEHLREILERPPFQNWKLRQARAERAAKDTLLVSILETIGEMVKSVFKAIGKWLSKLKPKKLPSINVDPSGFLAVANVLKVFGWIALAVLLAVLGVFLYRYARGARLQGHAAKILSREQVRDALESGEALALDSPDWLEEADRLAREREFRAVFRALYLALLSGLHSAGKIDFRRNRTNWTYVTRFRGSHDHRDIFSSLTSVFDHVWYGLKEHNEYSIDQVKLQVAALLKAEAPHG